MAMSIVPTFVISETLIADLLVEASPRLEAPEAEAQLKAMETLLTPMLEQVVAAYTAAAKTRVTERAFRRFLKNLAAA
ncbi:hypothetical protein [Pseudomonas sp. F1002]|uniref:hypothetical protein n=1 Tax=Pseudomonas sp. F1002 TaxID=2738821 RepID=UPI0015A02D9A|nr:hypothetical protein [Pseudomonas sp. F1002]NWB64473.1 hypothetical protein [Pseudomonas sp. F1002]